MGNIKKVKYFSNRTAKKKILLRLQKLLGVLSLGQSYQNQLLVQQEGFPTKQTAQTLTLSVRRRY